jgi:CRP-like cAMP-binding protein
MEGHMADFSVEALRSSPLFADLEEGELQALVGTAELRRYGGGEVVVEEETPGDTMFVLYKGEVVVEKSSPSGEAVRLASFNKRGDFFGEMVFVDVLPRSATIRAQGEAQLIEFRIDALRRFFETHREAHLTIVLNVARGLSQRLREADGVIAGLKGGK